MSLALTQVSCRCPRAAQFAIQTWADGVVVYDDASGSLHALTPIAGEALEMILAQQAHDVGSLAKGLGLSEAGSEDLEMLHSLLLQFESMGLIECAQG